MLLACSVPECRQVDDDHAGAVGSVDEEIIDSLSAALNDVALGVCVECEEVAGDVHCDQCTFRLDVYVFSAHLVFLSSPRLSCAASFTSSTFLCPWPPLVR